MIRYTLFHLMCLIIAIQSMRIVRQSDIFTDDTYQYFQSTIPIFWGIAICIVFYYLYHRIQFRTKLFSEEAGIKQLQEWEFIKGQRHPGMTQKTGILLSDFAKDQRSIPKSFPYDSNDIENDFIQKVHTVVATNYADENFALPQLCKALQMSRSQLFRKMKASINISPSAFIRHYRLQQARQLIFNGDMNVSEVAWAVGYKDVSHFSRAYLNEFGVRPSVATRV